MDQKKKKTYKKNKKIKPENQFRVTFRLEYELKTPAAEKVNSSLP